jgi:arylsulfatase A-like enzyme
MTGRGLRRLLSLTVATIAVLSIGGLPRSSGDDVVARPTSPDRQTSPARPTPPARPTSDEPPNIVLILTDDQRADTLRYMPIVRQLLVDEGIVFTNGYVVNPVCCPSRASILTGNYSHTTGVYTNRRPDGGFFRFDDESTLATWLQDAGYRTGLFGKYFNGYRNTTYVPPGWDRWFATYRQSAYLDYTAVSDGVAEEFGSDAASYGPTVLRDQAVSFIEETDPTTPVFVYWATHIPHEPATPAARDADAFSSLESWRPPSFDESDVTDKPAYVRGLPRIDTDRTAEIDDFRIRQIQSLQSVDRAVEGIVTALRDTGRLENTLIVFTSDNGMLWGEHRWDTKSVPYEEAIAVPFVVRFDAMLDEGRVDDHLVLNIDLAPTFVAAAGADAPEMEGRSLLPLLRRADPGWRTTFLIEHVGASSTGAPTFCAAHTDRYVLIRYVTGEEELYDLVRDPGQLVNRAGWGRYRAVRRGLLASLRELCDPAPPGYSI